MRISDWSSDVCSSDLEAGDLGIRIAQVAEMARARGAGGDAGRHAIDLLQVLVVDAVEAERAFLHHADVFVELARAVGAGPGAELAADAERLENGRASGRERGGQAV